MPPLRRCLALLACLSAPSMTDAQPSALGTLFIGDPGGKGQYSGLFVSGARGALMAALRVAQIYDDGDSRRSGFEGYERSLLVGSVKRGPGWELHAAAGPSVMANAVLKRWGDWYLSQSDSVLYRYKNAYGAALDVQANALLVRWCGMDFGAGLGAHANFNATRATHGWYFALSLSMGGDRGRTQDNFPIDAGCSGR